MLMMRSTLETLADTFDLLKNINLDDVDSSALVPLVKAIANIGAFAAALDAQITLRAVDRNELVPGVSLKDSVKHRQWHDEKLAVY